MKLDYSCTILKTFNELKSFSSTNIEHNMVEPLRMF